MRWDPAQYLRFADERGRPFADLLARVGRRPAPARVVDLGCGPGNLTATLAGRWPAAHVRGRRLLAGDDRPGGRSRRPARSASTVG